MKKLNLFAAIFSFLCAALVGLANFETGAFLQAAPDVVMLVCMAMLCLANALEK